MAREGVEAYDEAAETIETIRTMHAEGRFEPYYVLGAVLLATYFCWRVSSSPRCLSGAAAVSPAGSEADSGSETERTAKCQPVKGP